MTTTALFGSWILTRRDGAARIERDRWVLIEGDRIAAITADRPAADTTCDRPGRLVLPGLMNLHNHCFSEAIARSHTEDGRGRKGGRSIVYTVLLPLSKTALTVLSPGSAWLWRGSASSNS